MSTIKMLLRFAIALYLLFPVVHLKAQQNPLKLYIYETYNSRIDFVLGFQLISLHGDSTYSFVMISFEEPYDGVISVHSNKYYTKRDTLILEPSSSIKYKYLKKNCLELIPLKKNKRNKYKKEKTVGKCIEKTIKYLKYEKLPANYKKSLEEFGFELKQNKIIVPEHYRE